jgi:hypothetical protein
MYWLFVQSPDFSLTNYLNSTLAVFDTSDWGNPENTTDYFGPDPDIIGNETYATCRYRAYRSPPDATDGLPYDINREWLHVSAARLVFVAIFEVSNIN